MKLKNRKGSTLALTLMVFAVLMIFATFILSFMVTENKQAMYHQNKTQAYYLARSGAEVVETAILGIYNDANNANEINFFNKIYHDKNLSVNSINIDGNVVDVSLALEEIVGDDNNFLLNIIASSSVRNTTNEVRKVLNMPKPINKVQIKTDSPIVYMNEINDNIKEINNLRHVDDPLAVKAKDIDDYPLVEPDPVNFPESIEYNSIPLSGMISGDYYVENLNGNQLKNLKFSSKVNIFVKGKYEIDASNDISINAEGESKNLNIYVYGVGVTGNSVTLAGQSGINIFQKANLYVKTGSVSINAHKIEHKGNIVLGENVSLYINVSDNGSVGHANIEGMIYGPKSNINIGDDKKGALSVEGTIIGYNVNFLYKVNNLNSLKLAVDNSGGIKNPIEFVDQIVTTIEKGHFK